MLISYCCDNTLPVYCAVIPVEVFPLFIIGGFEAIQSQSRPSMLFFCFLVLTFCIDVVTDLISHY